MNSPHDSHPKVVISSSQALPILFTKMRDASTSSEEFVYWAKRAMRLVALDALAEFPTTISIIQTPCGPRRGIHTIAPTDLCAVSIIRSGDALLDSVREILPACKVGKILIQGDESHPDKLPELFYHKLPSNIANMFVLLCDPMLGIGGSARTALDVLVKEHGVDPKKIILANMICAPEGLEAMAKLYPEVKIVTAMVDSHLNQERSNTSTLY